MLKNSLSKSQISLQQFTKIQNSPLAHYHKPKQPFSRLPKQPFSRLPKATNTYRKIFVIPHWSKIIILNLFLVWEKIPLICPERCIITSYATAIKIYIISLQEVRTVLLFCPMSYLIKQYRYSTTFSKFQNWQV